jgi:Leucine Rich repeat
VAYLVQCCNNLEALLLDNCPYITDSGISFIAQHCPRIQVLGLSFCPISDVGLQSLAVHLSNHAHPKQSLKPRRKSIGVQPTSYSSLQEFKETPAAIDKVQLCEIYLAGCYRITPKGLTLLAETCPDLHVIVLDGCDLLLCWYHQAQGHTQIEDEEVLTLTRKQIMDVKLKK